MKANNEEYKKIVDEFYENYIAHNREEIERWIKVNPNILVDRQKYTKEEFINKIKTDPKFSKKWGLKIVEKELDLDDRRKMVTQEMFNQIYTGGGPDSLSNSEIDQWDIPKKIIKIKYTKKLKIYE
jgi:hypothetical protein